MPLVVIEPHPLPAELLAQNPVLLAQVINDLQLVLVHPPGNGDQQKMKCDASELLTTSAARMPLATS